SWPFFSLSTRWRQRSIYGIGSSEPSGSSSGGMERVFSAPVDPRDCNQGLQASVHCKTPSFQRGYSICSKRGFSLGVRGGNILPPREKSYKTSSSGGNSEGLLLPLFSNSKERWGFAPDTGTPCSKQALKEVQIQDAHIRRGDWFSTVDLKDAYFHISVYPAHRKYLRFSFQNEVLAPRAFSRCIEAALSPLRHKGLRISAYLDDYLICAH
ncbi:hypothetical protein M9458_007680, partial [Cirrhinus mrigala]